MPRWSHRETLKAVAGVVLRTSERVKSGIAFVVIAAAVVWIYLAGGTFADVFQRQQDDRYQVVAWGVDPAEVAFAADLDDSHLSLIERLRDALSDHTGLGEPVMTITGDEMTMFSTFIRAEQANAGYADARETHVETAGRFFQLMFVS